MKGLYTLLFVSLFCLKAQGQELIWEKTIGGDGTDWLFHSFQNSRGNYMFSGYSYSGISGDKTVPDKGGSDFWIIEMDPDGNILWQGSYGGSSMDAIHKTIELRDGTFLLAGTSYSGISADKTESLRGHRDLWIVKLDQNRNIEWQRTYGGSDAEDLEDVIQTRDNGFLITSTSISPASGDKTSPGMGESDIWVLKLDTKGYLEWQKSYGGSDHDHSARIVETSAGNYVIGASSSSPVSATKSQPTRGLNDYWVLEIDPRGAILWQNIIGGNNGDHFEDIKSTGGDGYILTGTSFSEQSGDKTMSSYNSDDIWVVKVDLSGNIKWQKNYGGGDTEWSAGISPSANSGFLIGAMSHSGIGYDKTEANRGDRDYWMFKISDDGEKCWDKTLGGSSTDQPMFGFEDKDGNYILGGWTDSGASGDKSQPSRGERDLWITKISVPDIPEPVVFDAGPYEACDNDRDGYASFDLSNLVEDLTGNEPNQELTYFDEDWNPLAIPNPEEFTNTTPKEQIINIRVSRTDYTCSSSNVQILLELNDDCEEGEGDGGGDEGEEPRENTFLFPKYFTPNGDGYNDRWQARPQDRPYLVYIYIFDRYGKLLKQLLPQDSWDGKYNGYIMPGDDYWFRAETSTSKVINGHFSLIN